MSDLDEFLDRVGLDVPTYRYCPECDEIYIVDPETFKRPKDKCDPDWCPYSIPICLCEDINLCTLEDVEGCAFPNCRCGNG